MAGLKSLIAQQSIFSFIGVYLKATHRYLSIPVLLAVSLSILVLASTAPVLQAQTVTRFTGDTEFAIPSKNASVRFAFNASYDDAPLQNGTLVFKNLAINETIPLGNLTVSAKDSQVTIYAFFGSQNSNLFGRSSVILYNAQGKGEQTFDLGLNLNRSTHQSEWMVLAGQEFLAEGKAWHLENDNTVTVKGIRGNVTIAYYGYRFTAANDSNKPWVEQHSVALATIAIVAATLAATTTIAVYNRRRSNGGN